MNQWTCQTMTIRDACQQLAAAGYMVGYYLLRDGLRQDAKNGTKQFPFGLAVQMESGKWRYVVFKPLLDQFIKNLEQGAANHG